MEPLHAALELLKRQADIEARLRQPGGAHVSEERELYVLRRLLQQYPEAVKAILETARNMNRTVDSLRPQDVR
jgi:hypothetical protein